MGSAASDSHTCVCTHVKDGHCSVPLSFCPCFRWGSVWAAPALCSILNVILVNGWCSRRMGVSCLAAAIQLEPLLYTGVRLSGWAVFQESLAPEHKDSMKQAASCCDCWGQQELTALAPKRDQGTTQPPSGLVRHGEPVPQHTAVALLLPGQCPHSSQR